MLKKMLCGLALLLSIVGVNSQVFAGEKAIGSGWVDVPLSDQSAFDINCEYRIFSGDGNAAMYATYVMPSMISSTGSEGVTYYVRNFEKSRLRHESDAEQVLRMHKRCY
jgi:hypothetical protein